MIASSESMYRFLHQSTSKLFLTILLISGIPLLCPASPFAATAAGAFALTTNVTSMPQHAANSGDTENHPGFESHNIISPQTAFLSLLFCVAFAILIFATRQLLLAANWAYLTKLKYYGQRYRILIKPKLETLFKHWLNLLGGTIAYSF